LAHGQVFVVRFRELTQVWQLVADPEHVRHVGLHGAHAVPLSKNPAMHGHVYAVSTRNGPQEVQFVLGDPQVRHV